jgi:hypothetical protein
VAKTWILDTETKGTGAHIAPLGSDRPRADRDLAIVTLERPPRPLKAPEPSSPRAFKVVDVMSAQVLAEGVGTRETLELLAGMKTMIDARIYVWVPGAERWRLLRLEEQRALWALRGTRTPDRSDTRPEG